LPLQERKHSLIFVFIIHEELSSCIFQVVASAYINPNLLALPTPAQTRLRNPSQWRLTIAISGMQMPFFKYLYYSNLLKSILSFKYFGSGLSKSKASAEHLIT
jgi:hypothetical protein